MRGWKAKLMSRGSVRLLQFTDTHLLSDPAGMVRGVVTQRSLEACIAHARARSFPVDAIALTGDLVQDDAEAYGTIELLFDQLGPPVLLIPGNHDLPDEMQRRLGQAPFQAGGSLELGAWTILLLSTWFADSADGEGRLGHAQLDELERQLLETPDRHVLICLHHPPIAMDSPGLDALGLLDAADFLSCIERHPQVRGIVFGHAHQSLDVYRGGLRLMCTPATCMQFAPRQPGFIVDDRPPGYRVIDLHEDGGIASEVIWLEGYAP